MTRFVVPIGTQYSGKTTFCKWVARALSGVEVVCFDDWKMAYGGSIYIPPGSPAEELATAAVQWQIKSYLERGDLQAIIVDMFSSDPDNLGRAVRSLRTKGDSVYGLHFTTPVETCLAWSRLRETDAHIPEEDRLAEVLRHRQRFEESTSRWYPAFTGVDRIDPRRRWSVEEIRRLAPFSS